MTDKRLLKEVANAYPPLDKEAARRQWKQTQDVSRRKIIVLDDDPTGVQTVHQVSVYTDWSEKTIEQGFREASSLFFILTNSRSFTVKETKEVHRQIAARIGEVSRKYNQPFLIISRSDSTLRGHYPVETEIMRQTWEEQGEDTIDGEIIIPYFKEGGRFTVDNIHYVQDQEWLIPAAETEFAKDRAFGFANSHLGRWIEEKTAGHHREEEVTYISLDTLRAGDTDHIVMQLKAVTGFGKVVVNALEEEDLMIFAVGLLQAMDEGKNFLFRTAATFTKIIGHIPSRKLLTKTELIEEQNKNGALVVIGSHVQKTTHQLEALKMVPALHFLEFDVHLVLDAEKFEAEVERIQTEAERKVSQGVTTVIYTKRERLDLGAGMKEEELKLAVRISEAVTRIVRNFSIRPAYILAKGGITSSDIGTKGLGVKRATVAGQAAPGIPVWKTGEESKFPGLSYVIFPGNVGAVDTLKDIVARLE